MPSIRLRGVRFAWPNGALVLDDATLHFPRGITAIVGANGAGKSTLLRLVSGELAPDAGRIDRDPPRPSVGRLDQADFGSASPGELRRARLGEVLRDRPDLLLLDEPSNHLDAAARRWLIGALRRYDGIGLLVSHDRELMEAVATHTVRLQGGRATAWALPYGEAREAWRRDDAEKWAERDEAQARVRQGARALGDARRTRDAADRQRSSAARMKSPKDHDARGSLAKGMAAMGEAAAGRKVGLARAELRRAAVELDAVEVPKELGRAVELGWRPSARPRVAEFEGEILGRTVRLWLDRHDRVWLDGPNGSGKSTLMRALAQRAADTLYLPQVLDEDAARADLDAVRALAPDVRGRVLSHLAALGADPARVLATPRPSPGEARKLRLAFGLGGSFAALLLDEPTNDLDLPAIERLEDALRRWPGAIVLITHDRALGAAVVPEGPWPGLGQ